MKTSLPVFLLALACASPGRALADDLPDAKEEHAAIGIPARGGKGQQMPHTDHPDAQWFPEAGFGLFLHWGLSSVRVDKDGKHDGGISWPMIPGRALGRKRIADPAERERIVRENDWNLEGHPPAVTPNQYWEAVDRFDPQKYDPDKWIAAAKAAGFTYAVLTTKHHEGFALWPSAYGDFNTKNRMGGRDLVKPFVEACRRHGLKVGLYYSPPDWRVERPVMNFLYHAVAKTNPEFPSLDADLKVRTQPVSPEEKARVLAAHNALVKGQVEELLTRYGKIDLLWFDGAIPGGMPPETHPLTQERIHELQPGIVLSPRLFWKGDYNTFEGPSLDTRKVQHGWGEWCSTWAGGWAYTDKPFYADGHVLGNLALARSLNINFLLGIGPDGDGELHPEAYRRMAEVGNWMKVHRPAVIGAGALPAGEAADVPATAAGNLRYLFAVPKYKKAERAGDGDMLPLADAVLTLKGLAAAPKSVVLMGDGQAVEHAFKDGALTVHLSAARRTKLPDVVKVELAP